MIEIIATKLQFVATYIVILDSSRQSRAPIREHLLFSVAKKYTYVSRLISCTMTKTILTITWKDRCTCRYALKEMSIAQRSNVPGAGKIMRSYHDVYFNLHAYTNIYNCALFECFDARFDAHLPIWNSDSRFDVPQM